MKKFTVISLIGLLIIAFSAVSFAQDKLEFKASGFIDEITEYWKNVSLGGGPGTLYQTADTVITPSGEGFNREAAYIETRARLKFDAVWGKEVSGTIYLEMDGNWGNADGTRNSFGYWNADRAAVEIKNIYIDWAPAFIPVPTTFRFGSQPLDIRSDMLVYTDGTGITGGIKIDPVTIKLYYFKAFEGNIIKSDDADVYGLGPEFKIGTLTLGGYGLYYDIRGYPISTSATAGTQSAKFWWAGVYADGKMGPVNINFDFIYDDGKVKANPDTSPTVDDVKYSGWATKLHVAYPWEKLTFGVVGMYATGADANKTDVNGLANGTNTKVKGYVVPPGSEACGGVGQSLVFYAQNLNRGNTGIVNVFNHGQVNTGGVGGSWFAKLYGSYNVLPEYKVTLQGLYIGDTTKHGNTVGTAQDTAGNLRDDKTIGWEADLINDILLTKQLKFSFGGGFLIPGKALDYWTGTENSKPSTPWIITSRLVYSF
jgi:hypothetical protein